MQSKNSVNNNAYPLAIILVIAALAVGYLYGRVKTLERSAASTSAVLNEAGSKNTSPKQLESKAGDVEKVTKDDHIRGDLDKAKLALIEYSDLECPFCKRFHPTAKQAIEKYGDDLVWVYRHFPLDQLHSKADKEAEATECAAELGGEVAFWAFVDKIFEVTPSNNGLDLDNLSNTASEIGLNGSEFKKCLDSGKYSEKVENQYQSGIKAGVNGTPGNILMDLNTGRTQLIPGAVPLDTLKEAIDKML